MGTENRCLAECKFGRQQRQSRAFVGLVLESQLDEPHDSLALADLAELASLTGRSDETSDEAGEQLPEAKFAMQPVPTSPSHFEDEDVDEADEEAEQMAEVDGVDDDCCAPDLAADSFKSTGDGTR